MLEAAKIRLSMSRRGNCLINAMAESFFATRESSCTVSTRSLRIDALDGASDFIENFYNAERLHSTRNCLSPIE